MRVAALDLGSNTSLLLVADMMADMDGAQIERVVRDETTITRLGQGVHQERRFHPDALVRMEACLKKYAHEIKKLNCDKVIAVATSAARDVKNGDALLALGRKYNIPIHIVEGPCEAALTFRGALSDRASSKGLGVVDVGGGSTEVIAGTATNATSATSLDIGSVRLSEMFVPADLVTEADQLAIQNYSEKIIRAAVLPTQLVELIAVAGTPTTLAALDQGRAFEENLVHGYRLTLERIEAWTEKLAAMPVVERELLPGMQPKRSDVIVAGAIILRAVMLALNQNAVTVSTRGVRYGVALTWQDF